jgi:hypothetical protein
MNEWNVFVFVFTTCSVSSMWLSCLFLLNGMLASSIALHREGQHPERLGQDFTYAPFQ